MKKEYYDLTAPQKSIWLTEQYYEHTNINNVCGTFYSSEVLDFDLFKKSLNIFLRNNDSFKIKLEYTNDEIKQYFSKLEDIDFDIIDIKNKKEQSELEDKVASKVFNILNSLLFEIVLFRYPEGNGGFIINSHHLISDSWTNGLVANEVALIYSRIKNKEFYEKDTKLSYKTYIQSELEYINSSKFEKDKKYWEEVFTTVPEVASIPAMKHSENNSDLSANRLLLNINGTFLENIKLYCETHKVSLYNFFMMIFSLYLGRVSNLDNFVIGTPILNRTNYTEKHTTGMFINTLPLRINLSHDKSFLENLKEIAINSMSLLRHQRYSYQYLIEDLRKKDSNLPKLYDVAFSYQITKMNENMEALEHSTSWVFNKTIADDLDIHMFEWNDDNSLKIAYDYKTNKYEEQDMKDIHSRILHVINQILENEDILLKDIEIVTPEEKHKILYEFNNTKADYPEDKTIVDLFEEQVEKTPDNIAVVFENQKLTYRELNEKANQLANFLLSYNLPSDTVVGILLERSLDIYISVFAILKLNLAYSLIDHNLPKDRIEYMLNNNQSSILLAHSYILKNKDINGNYKTICVDTIDTNNLSIKNIHYKIKPTSPCSVIYTSGSTGTPKGVILKHRGFINMFYSYKKFLHISNLKTFLSMSTVAFDMFAVETFISLLSGGTIILTNEFQQQSPKELQALIYNYNVDFILTTPSKIELLMMKNDSIENCLKNVKVIQLGGEILTPSLCKKISNITDANLYNGYGPTEVTACCSSKHIVDNIVNIGKPFCNTKILICDKTLNLLPIGHIGELCVCSEGLSLGYINNDIITQNSFVKSTILNDIVYKTGDLACWNKDGELEYFRRNDSQVKLRGLRIELNEISERIKEIDGVTNSIVVVKEINNSKSLCAYVATNNVKKITPDTIKQYLRKHLPAYMIPSFIVLMDYIPLNLNGKIDKNKLPLPAISQTPKENIFNNTTEEQLELICKKYIAVPSINIYDNLFEIGADSLIAIKISAEISNHLGIDISVKDIFSYPTIFDLAQFINNSTKISALPEIVKAQKKEYYSLSSAQKRIYYACQKAPDSTLYNVSGGFIIDSLLNKDRVSQAFNKLIQNNSILKTYFKTVNGVPKQFVNEDNIFLQIDSFADSKNLNIEETINNFPKPFDLQVSPLLRIELHFINNCKTLILIDSHHIILDGVSLNILMEEFCKLYTNESFEKPVFDYYDYISWEKQVLKSDKFKELDKYWSKIITDSPITPLNLPYDFYDFNINNFNGNRITQKVPKKLFERAENISKEYGISPYMLFLSAFYILLYKYTGQSNIIVGSPIAGREISELQNLLGMFVNNIILRKEINDEDTIINVLNEVKELVLESLSNQPYPYDLLLNNKSLSNISSLLDIMFVFQNIKKEECKIDNHTVSILPAQTNTAKFKILLEVFPNENIISLEYNTSLFKKETIESLIEHYIFILNQFLDNQSTLIKDIEILTNNEKKLLKQFNNTDKKLDANTIISLFEEQAIKHPTQIALICNNKTLTYKELNEKSNQLAHHLIRNGITKNDIVCIMTNRSFETIVAMLGILKSGAAFFNVDPTYPLDRTEYYIKDSKTKYVLTQHELKDRVSGIENCIEIDLSIENIYSQKCDNPNIKHSSEDLSYIIYTSGSTGQPKGVMLNQIGFYNMAKAMTLVLDYLKDGPNHTLLSVTSTPFDIFVYEIFVSLTHGLKVIMSTNEEHRNPYLLENLIDKYNADVMTVTPSLMKIIYDNRQENSPLSKVKNMVFGGEPLPKKFVTDLKSLASDITVYNIYGPSEITILSNVQNLNNESEITVGPPIMNTQIHILDSNMNPVPIGVVGEIYISGIQVGLGYIGKIEMTKEKFLKNPFGPGKIYKSGDIGRWTFEGKVQCLGRIDNQVKLRGLRIELGEIENKIDEIDGVTSCVVNKINIDNTEYLCAYYCSSKEISENIIRQKIRSSLPAYMLPSYFIKLKEMPYTINRKIDRKALPLPEKVATKRNNGTSELLIDLTDNEKKLLDIWKNILKIDSISIDDNFFDIGGSSITAISMQIEAVKYGINIEYSDIFNNPTIRQLACLNKNNTNFDIESYEYSDINNILSNNTISNLNTIKKANFTNVLIIGTTGFLGIHLIYEYLQKETGKVYCLIREKYNINPTDRLIDNLNFYFGKDFYPKYKDRIIILRGDITLNNLGLSDEDYKTVKNNVDVIINSGALVKHFGISQFFEDINVHGTENIVDFCIKNSKRLLHISTISISGNGDKASLTLNNQENFKVFKEKNLFIGQELEGIYSITKYKAEYIVLNAITHGLNASILRIGNITNRYSDGFFQKNVEDNAFAKRLKSFVEIGAIPKYSLEHEIELTPVDLCAEAIIKILQHESNCNVFHLYNNNLLSIKLLLQTLTSVGIDIQPVSQILMKDIINGILQDNTRKDILSGIIYDLDNDKNLIYTSNIRLDASFTNSYLEKIGFSWKPLNYSYIIKYIKYFMDIGFIK